MDRVLYEHQYYLVKETKQPTFLDFYGLEDKDFAEFIVAGYVNQTIQYKNKWFFVTIQKKYFSTEEKRDASPKVLIKYLYKEPKPISEECYRKEATK